jgi:hypothetical protein
VTFSAQYPQDSLTTTGFLYTEVQTFRPHTRSFNGIAAEGGQLIGLGGDDGTRRVSVLFVSPNYVQVLGVQPQLGRWFLPDEESEAVAPAVVGKSLRLTGVSVTDAGDAVPASGPESDLQ